MAETLTLSDIAVGNKVRLLRTQPALDALANRLPADEVLPLVEAFTLGLSARNLGQLATRLTLPLWYDGEVVAFRCLTWADNDPRPKAIPYPLPIPAHQPFGLTPATAGDFERLRFAVVVEGEVDALTLWALGIPAVACSTSYLASYHAAMLADLVDAAVVWLDWDEAGRSGLVQTMETLASMGVSCVGMEDAKPFDPNDLLREFGETRVKNAVTVTCQQAAMFPGGAPWS